jgi:hypothetical protein
VQGRKEFIKEFIKRKKEREEDLSYSVSEHKVVEVFSLWTRKVIGRVVRRQKCGRGIYIYLW